MDTARTSHHHSLFGGIAYGAGAGALWGLVFLAPELVGTFSPLEITIGRYLAYGVIAAALIAPRVRKLYPLITKRDWLTLLWLAIAGNTLYYILLSSAVQLSGIALTSLVIGFLPVVVTIIGSRDHGAIPLKRLSLSLMFCAAGALCIGWQAIVLPTSGSATTQVIGLLCAIGALISWTCFTVGNSRALQRLTQISAHEWNLLIGVVTGAQTLVLIPVAIALSSTTHSSNEWMMFTSVAIGVAVFASIAGNALWNRMSRMLPLTLVGQMILFETLFALIYGFVWEWRLPTQLETIAFVFVSLSVVSCIHAHRKPVISASQKAHRLRRIVSYVAGCMPPANSHSPL